jgi:hypothetical protein
MSAAQRETIKSRLEVLISLSRLLEIVEASTKPIAAEQYRSLVRQLSVALSQEIPYDALQAVLDAHPAAAELYEIRTADQRAAVCPCAAL